MTAPFVIPDLSGIEGSGTHIPDKFGTTNGINDLRMELTISRFEFTAADVFHQNIRRRVMPLQDDRARLGA